jgi:hypothetical protein
MRIPGRLEGVTGVTCGGVWVLYSEKANQTKYASAMKIRLVSRTHLIADGLVPYLPEPKSFEHCSTLR